MRFNNLIITILKNSKPKEVVSVDKFTMEPIRGIMKKAMKRRRMETFFVVVRIHE